jgi:hypothetical protein
LLLFFLVSIIIFVLLTVGFILCIIIYKKLFTSKDLFSNKKNSTNLKPKTNFKNNDRQRGVVFNKSQKDQIKRIKFAPSVSSLSGESITKQEYNKSGFIDTTINDDEHKYHEITDFISSTENTISIINNDEMPQSLLLVQNDNYYYKPNHESGSFEIKNENLPPPYNKIHMFKNASRNNSLNKKTYIHGKSTYV